jgi:hypothetical protein
MGANADRLAGARDPAGNDRMRGGNSLAIRWCIRIQLTCHG